MRRVNGRNAVLQGILIMNRRSCPSIYAWRPVVVIVLLLLAGLVAESQADPQTIPKADEPLRQLSLADLGNVEVTTASK